METKKKTGFLKWVLVLAFLFVIFSIFTYGMNKEIPLEEKVYLDNVLSKITADSTKTDVVSLLGNPSRDLELKVNWEVTINDNNNRIEVYFSGITGKATRIDFDGGIGRFYYRKDLKRWYYVDYIYYNIILVSINHVHESIIQFKNY